MKLRFTREIDMRPEAVADRLRDLGQLYALAISLQSVRFLGPRPNDAGPPTLREPSAPYPAPDDPDREVPR